MFDRCRVFFLRSWMFDRCRVFFLRSWMFDRCRVFFFLEMWCESLIFERDGSWMRFGLPTKKKRSDLGSSWFIDSIVRGLLSKS